MATGTTYGSIEPGTGSQSAVYFTRLDGATGAHTPPMLIDNRADGHQLFPDISANGGVLHALWWDSRHDPCYSPTRPIGNCADRTTVPALDVFATPSTDCGHDLVDVDAADDVTSNPNYEQFAAAPCRSGRLPLDQLGRPFAFGTWTDWRNTVAGRRPARDRRATTRRGGRAAVPHADASGAFTGDTCPRNGGLDQNIYGAQTP